MDTTTVRSKTIPEPLIRPPVPIKRPSIPEKVESMLLDCGKMLHTARRTMTIPKSAIHNNLANPVLNSTIFTNAAIQKQKREEAHMRIVKQRQLEEKRRYAAQLKTLDFRREERVFPSQQGQEISKALATTNTVLLPAHKDKQWQHLKKRKPVMSDFIDSGEYRVGTSL
eukprot:TRINITY_DN542621_c0_g1_i1.p1 TRINITY_DN542621_c0_g1~~TRINITY_DN542621_c0_g1_i1.p1  ORF type:complete len:169 (+),score=28.73 TRINITY_DN542621_c0_g1_i1:66-572(+)